MVKIAHKTQNRNHKTLADRAKRDGKNLARQLQRAKTGEDVSSIHSVFRKLAAFYGRFGIIEFEQTYYRGIQ